MIEIPAIKKRNFPCSHIDLYAYPLRAYTHILLDINPYTNTWSRACKFTPLSLSTSPLLSLSLSLTLTHTHAVSLYPFGYRRSTIDASSLPASARIYGNVYAGRSYIRGFWRIAYIREILITWFTLPSPPLRPFTHVDIHAHYLQERAELPTVKEIRWPGTDQWGCPSRSIDVSSLCLPTYLSSVDPAFRYLLSQHALSSALAQSALAPGVTAPALWWNEQMNLLSFSIFPCACSLPCFPNSISSCLNSHSMHRKIEIRLPYSKGNSISKYRNILGPASVEKINQNLASYNRYMLSCKC